ncbi:cardiolipin synthase [Leuconostoc mesenteroides]|uniref:Cardiolipin synthase n=2 Tax=Leuconostoc TaxID=1243 RepID=C2KL41_LEUMC|nr:cardiolipin synthase [Leuconostoc mesenteroides]KDA52540.1 Cardiolipin synthetase [Leuconostoc mesenteroides subsp. cremoris T26]EEJ42039.1 phospholipase D domain protein [Leuconostoc mesenteroides subsp. cremoris ATCC 19254]MDG9750577.1 cardiolipin synthase [Leuconostoc mesenteroides]ORI39297.1 cardiolipin synthase [Leuconostoc mesenteroides subsp. cremoris]ORI40110.1 cardiolipin synthase [Leuconostoc mesenteroides subsp. cremoris]
MLRTSFWIVILIALVINTIISFIAVFRQKREIATIWAWMLVLLLLPVVGFSIFFLAGSRISSKKIFRLRTQEQRGLDQIALNQKKQLQDIENLLPIPYSATELLKLFLSSDRAVLTRGNKITIFSDGQKKFDKLFSDIRAAKEHIHLEYFSIFDDKIGHQLVDLLTEKASEGVEVRVIYDQFGSHGQHPKMYRQLRAAGGVAVPFLMRRFQLLTLRFNFRNHRKIAIIDGKIGYIGGFNVGDQYIGESKKFGYWRDTHTRIIGDAVLSLQSRFLMDWNATAEGRELLTQTTKYFPENFLLPGKSMVQIVSSGPDDDMKQIKQGYMRMFSSARESISIQTPYFIPDGPVLETLEVAILSGVKVKLMIPNQPDHPLVYRATEYYAQELIDLGATVYRYDGGFLHSKVVIIDNEVATVGSANMDIRSFSLNFEGNAFIYDPDFAADLEDLFEQDVLKSTKLTMEYFEKQSAWMKFKQKFSRLFSPIL